MGQYDKQIAQAKDIGKDWVKTSEGYRAQFESIKKDSLKLEKDALGKVQKDVQKGLHEDPKAAARYLDEIATIRERLETYLAEGKRVFDEHNKWALGDPRSNMGYIGKQLKLGDAKSEAYRAVAEGVKRQLTDVATAISTTQKAWDVDLKFALKTQRDRLEALESILNKDQGKHSAFIGQIKKEADRYLTLCDKAFSELKVTADVNDLAAVKGGKMAEKDELLRQQKYQLYQKKGDMIPKIVDMIEKNHKRVLKSVPKQFLDGFMTSQEKKMMEDKKKEILDKLKQAVKLYAALKAAFEKEKLV